MDPAPDCGESSYRGSGKLTGKVAVITGGDSGIGRAVAIAYAREGADVVISYLSEDEDAEDTARWVEEAGRKAVAVAGDVSEAAALPGDRRPRRRSEFGRIDILVNNAAYQMSHADLEEISDEEWEHTFATNVSAMFYLVKAALPHMPPGSSIIGSTSVNSDMPSPDLAPYAATKAAIANFCASLAQMLGPARHPGEQRRARPDLDAADPGDDAAREGRAVRRRHPARADRASRPSWRAPTCCSPPTRAATCPAPGSR